MPQNPDSPLIIGSLSSSELSDSQLKLVTVIKYFAKVSAHVSAEPITVRGEQPEGLQHFLQEKENFVKTKKREPTKDEIEKLEKEFRYDTRNTPIGNAQTILSRLITEAFQSNKVRAVLDSSIDDAIQMADKSSIMLKAKKTIAKSDLT